VFRSILIFLFGSGFTVAAIVGVILANPEKAEKWFALFWKGLMNLHLGLQFAHKKYVEHDFQGNVNEFVRKHAKDMPGFQVKGVKLEWIEADVKRQAFLEADRVVVRVRRHDPHHENFVKAVYLFVSTSLLYRAKRYISPPQGRAIDLFVTTEIFREQRPEVVHHFLEEYLHPQIDDGSARVTTLFEQFDVISKAGLFFPVFLQEMDYLGLKVFGKAKNQEIVTEVNALIEFLRALALRRVGSEETDLNFVKLYCRFAVVIVGKSIKLKKALAPTAPYVKFIRDGLERNVESVYLVGHAENEHHIKQICAELSDKYDVASEKKFTKVLIFGEEKRKLHTFLAVLRAKNRQLYVSTASEP
jgi:hypothetical protein